MGLLAISILPVAVLGTFIYNRDKNKESVKLLIKLFLAGLLSTFLSMFITVFLGLFFPIFVTESSNLDLFELFFYAFFGVALVEEFSKWIMVYKISYNHEEFDEVYDAIVYTTFVSLGFACFENILYVLDGGIVTGIVRAIFAVPGHACDGVLMGYFLGFAKVYQRQNDQRRSKINLALSLVVPVISHGIYDYCAMSYNSELIFLFFVFVGIMFIHCFKTVKQISKEEIIINNQLVQNNNYQPVSQQMVQNNNYQPVNQQNVSQNNFCPNCGTKVESIYCPKCGRKNM